MSSELTIQPRVHVPRLSEGPAQGTAATAPVAAAKPGKLFANPDFRFDPAAGLVVIEFRDAAGKITDTIPNQRQLDAYRAHEKTPRDKDAPPVIG